jgi:hypothetical protein
MAVTSNWRAADHRYQSRREAAIRGFKSVRQAPPLQMWCGFGQLARRARDRWFVVLGAIGLFRRY